MVEPQEAEAFLSAGLTSEIELPFYFFFFLKKRKPATNIYPTVEFTTEGIAKLGPDLV